MCLDAQVKVVEPVHSEEVFSKMYIISSNLAFTGIDIAAIIKSLNSVTIAGFTSGLLALCYLFPSF